MFVRRESQEEGFASVNIPDVGRNLVSSQILKEPDQVYQGSICISSILSGIAN